MAVTIPSSTMQMLQQPYQAPQQTMLNAPAAQPQTARNQNPWTSPEVLGAGISTGTALLGGYLSQRNANNQQTAQNQFSAQQNAQQQQADLQKLQMQLEQSRILQEKQLALQSAQAAPQRQDWRQKQALLAALLPEMRNYQVTAPGRLSQFQPQLSGGMRLPEGGLDASTLAFFSPQARLAAESDFDRQAAQSSGGQLATPNYAAAGYGQMGNAASGDVQNYTQQILQQILKPQPQPTAGGQSAASPFPVDRLLR